MSPIHPVMVAVKRTQAYRGRLRHQVRMDCPPFGPAPAGEARADWRSAKKDSAAVRRPGLRPFYARRCWLARQQDEHRHRQHGDNSHGRQHVGQEDAPTAPGAIGVGWVFAPVSPAALRPRRAQRVRPNSINGVITARPNDEETNDPKTDGQQGRRGARSQFPPARLKADS